jgi:hypothetical protein
VFGEALDEQAVMKLVMAISATARFIADQGSDNRPEPSRTLIDVIAS